MKVRNGFVSNSSSSSFCIYGTTIEEDEVIEIVRKLNDGKAILTLKNYKDEEYTINLDDEEDENYEVYTLHEFIMSKATPLTIHGFDDEYYYIGREYTSINEDETGKQFKESVDNKLKEILDKEFKCDTIEESTYNG